MDWTTDVASPVSQKRERVNRAFQELIDLVTKEAWHPSRELALVTTNLQQAMLWFSALDLH